MIRVTQLSDTHFADDGVRTHSGIGYDTDATFSAVLDHMQTHHISCDFAVVTGDVADRGKPAEYDKARHRLERFAAGGPPVLALSGNHDFHAPFEALLPSPRLAAPRSLRVRDWLFLFTDTNSDGRVHDSSGHLRDRPDRIDVDGAFSEAEMGWINDTIAASDAAHIFLWGHHPPFIPGAFRVKQHDERFTDIVRLNSRVRGFGGGHVHTDAVIDGAGVPVHVCPSLTFNFDLAALTALPPGYRTYEFHDDGAVTSDCHLVDGPAWPRFPLPEPGVRFLHGDITWDEMLNGLGVSRTNR